MLSRNRVAALQVARKRLDLDEDHWRAVLTQAGGVESVRELDVAGFRAVMGFLDYLDLAPGKVRGPTYGDRPGFASPAQVQLIRELWWEWCGLDGDDDVSGLTTWLTNSFGIANMRFVTRADAGRIITALKAMKARGPAG